MNFKKTILSLSLLTVLTACSSTDNRIPNEDPAEYQYDAIKERLLNDWQNKEIPITYIDADIDFGIEKRNKLTDTVKNIDISNLTLQSATLADLRDLLKNYDINIFIPDSEIENKSFSIRNFSGSFGDLVEIIESGYNLSFSQTNSNNIILRDFSVFTAPIPQDEESASDLVSSLESLGAENTNYSLAGGFVIYQSTHNNQETIREYLKAYYKNFAVIKLQVAIITVNLDRETNTGFDWSSLQAVFGNQSLIDLAANPAAAAGSMIGGAIGSGAGNNNNDSNDGGNEDNGSTENGSGSAWGFNSNQAQGVYKSGNRDIQAAFNLLNTYGVSNATQSIFLETISGKTLQLRSGKEVPYTSNINQNFVGGGNNSNVNSLSGFQSNREKEGLTVDFQPYFNYKKNTITLGLDLNLRTIVGFQEINSGNSNGTVEQPITQEQEFNSVVEIRPGQAHLVGGITFTLTSDTRNNLNFLGNLPTASNRSKNNQNALFILLRPTVSIYGRELSTQ